MAERPRYPFPKSWQSKLLSLLIVNGSQFVAEGLVKSEYFENLAHSQICETVINLYTKHGVPLTFNAVREALREAIPDEEEYKNLSETLKSLERNIKPIEEKLIIERVKRFSKHQAFKIAIRDSLELLESDDLDQVEKIWNTALLVGRKEYIGNELKFFSSFHDRQQKLFEKPDILATLIAPLDAILSDHGFHRKELIVFLGLPGIGKSFSCQHMAKASIIQKKRTILYTLEMSAEKVAYRLDASFSGVELRDLRSSTTKIEKRLHGFEKRFGDLLIIKEYPAGFASIATIRAHLLSLKMQGFDPEVMIVDYINLLARDLEIESGWKGLGEVYIGLRSLTQEFNMWGITAAQSNRAGFESELITMKDIGESFEGAMHSDIIISLNRTQDEKQKNLMRLFIAKNRSELDSIIIPISTNFAKGAFYRRKGS